MPLLFDDFFFLMSPSSVHVQSTSHTAGLVFECRFLPVFTFRVGYISHSSISSTMLIVHDLLLLYSYF